ncbi:MAG: thioredoxin domain-containing protein [Acidobacteriaceae bacterium]|nr:thioredoxin domain-containing protein [Acidobacteriaceae bacterium]
MLAQVDGTKITFADVEQKRSGSLFQARNSYYQVERKALDEYIDQYLLERQAQKEKVTVDQLLEKHVKSTLPKDPSEESLRVYYEGVDTTEPFEAVRDQILDNVRQRRFERARTAYIQSLRREANIAIMLAPPRTNISLNNTPVRGPQTAPVVVVEYADYECPYCQQIDPVLLKLENEYKGRVAFAYKDTPLPMHPHAEKAAEAAHCAGAQGKYWEYHDVLFASKQYEIPALKQSARTLNLDAAVFDKCLDSGEQKAAVTAQLEEAQRLGLQGTPSFFINGRFLSGAVSYEMLRNTIEQELSAATPPREIAGR